MMCKRAVFLVTLMITAPALASSIGLTKGRLDHQGSYAIQAVAVTNNTAAPLQAVHIECGFFHKGSLLAASDVYVRDIRPNQTAYAQVFGSDAPQADATDCRIAD